MTSQTTSRTGSFPILTVLLGVILFAFGAYAYATFRYGGDWIDSDTAMITRTIASVTDDGSVLNTSDPYGNGFTYQVVASFLIQVTGITVQQLQRTVMPLGAGLLALVVFVAFRALLGKPSTALLATLLLFMQPDFLFVTWRGSHEKITWALALTLLYLLAKGFRDRGFASLSGLYYFVAFAFVCCNAFFASSFLTGLAFSFIAGLVVFGIRRRIHRDGAQDPIMIRFIQRTMYVTLATGVLLYRFFFYVYPPSVSLLFAFDNLVDRVAALFVQYGTASSSNPYSFVTATWIDSRIYLVLIGVSLMFAGFSVLVWLPSMFNMIFRRSFDIKNSPSLLLWLMYPVFALQVAFALIADRTSAGGNLQLRLFTPLMILAVPLVSSAVMDIWRKPWGRVYHTVVLIGLALAGTFFTGSGLLKLTNEPILSNNWVFTLNSERAAGTWAVEHAEHNVIWTGPEWRLTLYLLMAMPKLEPTRLQNAVTPGESADQFIVSRIEEVKWRRWHLAMPRVDQHMLMYDNGAVRVYQKRMGIALPTS
ncbi:MAG: hypothetical protein WA009_17300 [Phototrophicaceae bacterium]